MTIRAPLTWKRDGKECVLLAGRRRFGRVVRDTQWPGMWRSTLSGGRLSDMANMSWTKNAVLVAAERELEYETRPCKTPSKCPEKRAVFEHTASQTAQTEVAATLVRSAVTQATREAA